VKVLERYIAQTVAANVVVVATVLVAIYTFLAFLDELGDLGRGRYGLLLVVEYVALTIPRRIYELFPACALLGTLIGLGSLAASSELTAMRAGGVSMARIVGALARVGVVLMVAVTLLGEWVAPAGEQYAQTMRSIALSGQIALKSRHGFWVRDGLRFINIRQVLAGAHLGDITVYEFDKDRRLRTVAHAKEASFLDGNWQLRDIDIYHISQDGVSEQHMVRADWKTLLRPDLVKVVVVDPQDLSFTGLWTYIRYLRANKQDARRYQLALWVKLAAPFSTGVMVFVAIPFVFGTLRSVGVGQRIMAGTLVGMGFYLLNQTLSHVGLVYNLSPFVSAFLPSVLFLSLAFVMLRRVY
jgi:lipopolysaccharide export system permease protein